MRLSYSNCQRKAFAIKNPKTLAYTYYNTCQKQGYTSGHQLIHCPFFRYYGRVVAWGQRQGDCNRIVPSSPTKIRLNHLQELSKFKYIWRLWSSIKSLFYLLLQVSLQAGIQFCKWKTLLMKTGEGYGEQKLKDLKLLLTCRVLTFTQKTQQCLL